MRVKLQLVMCHDKGDEETVTDLITLNKNNTVHDKKFKLLKYKM